MVYPSYCPIKPLLVVGRCGLLSLLFFFFFFLLVDSISTSAVSIWTSGVSISTSAVSISTSPVFSISTREIQTLAGNGAVLFVTEMFITLKSLNCLVNLKLLH